MKDFFTCLAICNTVVVSSSRTRSGTGVCSSAGSEPAELEGVVSAEEVQALKYEAESPDEAALVHVCT